MNATTSPLRRASILLCALTGPLGLAAEDRADKPMRHHYKLIEVATFGGPNFVTNFIPVQFAVVRPRASLRL